MANSNLSVIESEVIRDALRETVENKLKSKNYKINVSSASQAGANNFIGIVHRVSFYKDDDSENGANASKLILKVAPTSSSRRSGEFTPRIPFLQEIYMYTEVLPYFRKFEQSKGIISEENGFSKYPECYQTLDADLSECIFLEDLNQRSFRIIDKSTEALTAEHVNLVMHSLAKFHAISFALNDQQPEKFKELASNLTEVFFQTEDNFFKDYFNKQARTALDTVTSAEDIHFYNKVQKLLEKDAMNIAIDDLNAENIGSAVVISHGDTWQNNIMFKYDANGKPIDISILDWQISRCASPIHDIVYFIFNCTTKELRDAQYDNFLRIYHDSLSAHIQRLGSDPEKLFPFELMQEHFRKFGRYGLLMATGLLPMITADKGNVVNMDELFDEFNNGKEVDANIFISDASRNRLNKRLRDVVVDMVRLNYI